MSDSVADKAALRALLDLMWEKMEDGKETVSLAELQQRFPTIIQGEYGDETHPVLLRQRTQVGSDVHKMAGLLDTMAHLICPEQP